MVTMWSHRMGRGWRRGFVFLERWRFNWRVVFMCHFFQPPRRSVLHRWGTSSSSLMYKLKHYTAARWGVWLQLWLCRLMAPLCASLHSRVKREEAVSETLHWSVSMSSASTQEQELRLFQWWGKMLSGVPGKWQESWVCQLPPHTCSDWHNICLPA